MEYGARSGVGLWGSPSSSHAVAPHVEGHFRGLSSAVKTDAQADSPTAFRPLAGGDGRGVWSLDHMSSGASALVGPCLTSAED